VIATLQDEVEEAVEYARSYLDIGRSESPRFASFAYYYMSASLTAKLHVRPFNSVV